MILSSACQLQLCAIILLLIQIASTYKNTYSDEDEDSNMEQSGKHKGRSSHVQYEDTEEVEPEYSREEPGDDPPQKEMTEESDSEDSDESLEGRGTLEKVWTLIQDLVHGVSGQGGSNKKKTGNNIRYLLGSKKSRGSYTSVTKKGYKMEDDWVVGGPVKVLIHGFTPEIDETFTPEQKLRFERQFDLGNAYASQNKKSNIILVDWTSLSTHTYLKYFEAADGIKHAAKDAAKFLVWLKTKKGLITNWKDVHIIGFSLGSHVAGATAQRIFAKTGTKVGRVTGIDPAGPLFHDEGRLPANRKNVLDYSDGEFVDVIHCNMGWDIVSTDIRELSFDFGSYGTPAVSGHVDFFPNGGETQVGCSHWDDKTGCSHKKCLALYLQTFRKKFLACPCTDWGQFKAGKCTCTESNGAYIGEKVDPKTAKGRYYLSWAE